MYVVKAKGKSDYFEKKNHAKKHFTKCLQDGIKEVELFKISDGEMKRIKHVKNLERMR